MSKKNLNNQHVFISQVGENEAKQFAQGSRVRFCFELSVRRLHVLLPRLPLPSPFPTSGLSLLQSKNMQTRENRRYKIILVIVCELNDIER